MYKSLVLLLIKNNKHLNLKYHFMHALNSFKFKYIFVLFICCQFAGAQVQQLNHADTIPFTLTDHNNISVQARINISDTVDLMFHTAANSITITEEASKTLENVWWDSDEEDINSWGGSSKARSSYGNALSIQGMHWDLLSIWENKNSGPNTDGKFGPNLFEGYAIELNFDKHILILHKELPEITKEYVKMPIKFEDGFMFIEGVSYLNGIEYTNQFLVHSGYGGTVLFDDKFVAESHIGKHIEIIDEKELKDSYGNVIKTKKGKLPQFSIGDISFNDMPVGFFEGTIGRQQMSVLGGDLLKRFNIVIDKNRTFIYLKPSTLFNTAYTKI